jgi:1-phosphofructokinase
MIYTVTFNPAIDYVMRTDELQFGQTNRSLHEELYFGGKGINVSTVLSHLGFESTALGFIAGFTGEALEKGIAAQGIRTDFIRLSEGCTRINVKLKGALETEINAQGPSIDADALTKLYAQLEKLTADDTLVLAGSVPQTLPSDIYETIVAKLAPRGVRCIVDATGSLLTNVLKYHPFLIKPNRSELEEIMKKPLPTDLDIQRAARHMQEAGAVNVLVSLGKDGALLLDEHGQVYRQPAFSGHVLNTVGSGDSMVAGFIAGLARGYEYALRLGTAAGSATAFAKGLATREEIQALL